MAGPDAIGAVDVYKRQVAAYLARTRYADLRGAYGMFAHDHVVAYLYEVVELHAATRCV